MAEGKRDGNCLFVFARVCKAWRKAQLKVGGRLRTRVLSDVILPGQVALVKWALADGCPREDEDGVTIGEDQQIDEEGSYWVRPEQTLGLSPARPYLPTGNEMPEIPSFIETDAEGRKFAKIFPPLFPKKNDIEPFVSNAQTFDVRLYNHFVEIFNLDADLKTENTNFGDFGMPMHIEHNEHLYERENAGVFSFDEGDEREHPFTNTESFEIHIPLRPQHTNGETSIVIDWGGAEVEERGWSTYYEILDDNTLIPVSASEVPETLTELHYGSVPETADIAPHEIDATLGSDRENWVDPDFSCYDCEDMSVCDPKVYETVLDDESTVSYQWFRFRDQPLFCLLYTSDAADE